jgi:exodeoxyribonuclease V beta subunit
MQPPPPPFDLTGPLPTGTTVLQASAGTGKTFTIAGLVARYVGEGEARMDELLVVSFSRESTRELRGRVRERLVSARDGLHAPPPDDAVLQHLAACDPAERARRQRRLRDALASFDAATVTTTHGFCEQVLQALGTAGDHDADAVLVEDMSDLVAEVADDLYLRKWGAPGTPPPDLTVNAFRDLAQVVAAKDPATRLVPDASTDGLPGLRARIAVGVREETERRKRRQSLLGYDDMLMRVQATLLDPVTGPAAVARLRGRYRKVLVDEFQDTDPVQWSILHEAFHGARTLVLIGDPKQAIYAFRGADVTPTCRRPRSPITSARCPTTGAATPSCCAGSTRCSAARRWATRASGCSLFAPRTAADCSARRAPYGCASSGAMTCRSRSRAWRRPQPHGTRWPPMSRRR